MLYYLKSQRYRCSPSAITLKEVVFLLAVVSALAILGLFALSAKSKTRRSSIVEIKQCQFNLKNIGQFVGNFADAHGGLFPSQVPRNDGGVKEEIGDGSPIPYFKALQEHIPDWPMWDAFTCVADDEKSKWLTNQSAISLRVTSYFISWDATFSLPNAILAGDRNLEQYRQKTSPGLFVIMPTNHVSWTTEIHCNQVGDPSGNILFSDGHVENIARNLDSIISKQGMVSNRLAIP